MRSGLYALASLGGAPLQQSDLQTLTVQEQLPGLAGCALDPQPGATDQFRTAGAATFLAGYLDEPAELASALGRPPDTSPAALAAAALAQFGAETPAQMLGEWSLLHWDMHARELTLVTSESLRDPVFFAALPNETVAVAPSAMLLGRLASVGLALDPQNFALLQGRAGLRKARTTETIWRGIRQMQPGSTERFRQGSRSSARVTSQVQFERWESSFEEGAEALDAVGRRIVRQHMERHPVCAFLLSGGLDSTLLNCWGVAERGPGRSMFSVSSVAPPGSARADESLYIQAVADALAIDSLKTWPLAEDNLFLPSAEAMRQAEGLVSGPNIVHQAMNAVARAGGATALIDGAAGEMHLSRGSAVPETRSWVRQQLAHVRDEVVHRQRFSGWPVAAFHVQLQAELMEGLPSAWARAWRKGVPSEPKPRRGDPPMGIHPMAAKQAPRTTEVEPGLRSLLPFRDQRLMRLAARMPFSFLGHDGLTRPLARRLLLGRVPDLVRLRTNFMPFSPDYVSRMKQQAAGVQTRMGLFREAGAETMIDLVWLSEALVRLAASRDEQDYHLYFKVQGTAAAAEFLVWARSEGVSF